MHISYPRGFGVLGLMEINYPGLILFSGGYPLRVVGVGTLPLPFLAKVGPMWAPSSSGVCKKMKSGPEVGVGGGKSGNFFWAPRGGS